MDTREQILIRPAKAAKILDMSRSKVYDGIRSGQIPSIRIAGQLRIPLEAIHNLVFAQLEESCASTTDENKSAPGERRWTWWFSRH